MTQLQLPIIEIGLSERIARILNGPVSGKVHQASVYFDEVGEREARSVAEGDGARHPPQAGPVDRGAGQVGYATSGRGLYTRRRN